jgi:hypothetical protein
MPFAEGEIGGDEDGGALVESADEVEQQLAAGLSERQVAEFFEDEEVQPGQMLGDATLPPLRVSVSSRLTRSTTL